MVVLRRVHNSFHIQPQSKNSDVTYTKSPLRQNPYTATHYTLELVLLVLAIVVPFSVQAGVFQNIMSNDRGEVVIETALLSDLPVDAPVLVAAANPDPNNARGGAEVTAQDGVLISTGPVGKDIISAARSNSGEISVYTVRPGDSLSQIAEMFDVTSNTILWANDLPRASAIKPGDALVILPVAGVRHVVRSGDSIAVIAKKYEGNAEEIISYNQLDNESDLRVGETLVIPGGAIHTSPVKAQSKAAPTKSSGSVGGAIGSFINPVPGAIKTQGLHGYNAVDFGGAIGSPIRAAQSGVVLVAKSGGWNGGYGNYIVIKHKNGTQTLYAHLSRVDVGVGATVAQGTAIGALGNTGKSTGPHLHFEVRGGKNPF